MLKSHERFHSQNGKRLILIADDEYVNRELLRYVLKDSFDILVAEDGEETIRIIKENADLLSLIMIDLMMPKVHGLDILKWIKAEPEMQHIPVIVLTADQGSEVECLKLGAVDFIPKPYPQNEVIEARVRRSIELSEDREIIQSTERDPLTGLFNKEYFYRYAEQYDNYHKDVEMDAIVIDINHFHMINERYGKHYGNDILRRIGEHVREMVQDTGGIVCRREADTFLIYCPHGKDYQQIFDSAVAGLRGENPQSDTRVRLRMGVYSCADKTIDIERRFDRAKMAADTVKNSFTRSIAIYDNKIHESEIYAEQLIEDFQKAIDEKEFKIYYQPKFDIHSEIPVLSSAEALVRWIHTELGNISPGTFIPLFENNGLIQKLDGYVWREAASQIADWKQRFGITIPVSVNVSRVDMYDPNLVDNLIALVNEFSINPRDFLLEITESAYTQDSSQIIEKVNSLRKFGFRIEMDDFGTGYSSLSMISSLPIDALKLDMHFIRNAFSSEKDIRMLELIIDMADYLAVPIIAEGVETEEQLKALKSMGCDIVQGYYFSRPVPPEEYERFIIERKNHQSGQVTRDIEEKHISIKEHNEISGESVKNALPLDFEKIYYINFITGDYLEFSPEGEYDDLQISRRGNNFFDDIQSSLGKTIYQNDIALVNASLDKNVLLSQLVTESRFSMTFRIISKGVPIYYNLKAVKPSGKGKHHIIIGLTDVNDLILQSEDGILYGQKRQEYYHIASALSEDYESVYYINTLTERYTEYIPGKEYEEIKMETSGENFFDECRMNIIKVVYPEDQEKILNFLEKDNILSSLADGSAFSMDYRLVVNGNPVNYRMKVISPEKNDTTYIVIGIINISDETKAREALFKDPLTGVKNKRAYTEDTQKITAMLQIGKKQEFAVVICDLNGLKQVNDTQGHQAGDEYIKTACAAICRIFKHSPVYRIGGDEFSVILRGEDYKNRAALMKELSEFNDGNKNGSGVVIACGITEYLPGTDQSVESVFERADSLMYENKKNLKYRS